MVFVFTAKKKAVYEFKKQAGERRGFFSLHFLRFSYFVYAGECGELPSQDPQILENAPFSSSSSFYKRKTPVLQYRLSSSSSSSIHIAFLLTYMPQSGLTIFTFSPLEALSHTSLSPGAFPEKEEEIGRGRRRLRFLINATRDVKEKVCLKKEREFILFLPSSLSARSES